jgi:uncharacterized membrane protein YkvA (DUF1232 family)
MISGSLICVAGMKTTLPVPQSDAYGERYSERSFWRKLRNGVLKIGRKPVEAALTLFLTLKAPETPGWCRTVIIGALGYFISLIDAIPDLTPVLGYTDDLGVMLAAIAVLGFHVTPEIRQQARDKTDRLFGTPSSS